MGEVNRIAKALKTIQGICNLYSVSDYTAIDETRIAVYNCQNDNFHFFRWSSKSCRYIYCGSQDCIPNWKGKRVAI